jgi:hypothetical protein
VFRERVWMGFRNEPKGSSAKYCASTVEGPAELIQAAPVLPKRIPSLPERAPRWEPADPETLARVLGALRPGLLTWRLADGV